MCVRGSPEIVPCDVNYVLAFSKDNSLAKSAKHFTLRANLNQFWYPSVFLEEIRMPASQVKFGQKKPMSVEIICE